MSEQPQWEGPLEGFVRVEVFDSRGQAEVARSALEARAIPSTLLADDDGGIGGISLSLDHQGAELRVPHSRWVEAREALGLPSEPIAAPRAFPVWAMLSAATLLVAIAVGIAVSIVG